MPCLYTHGKRSVKKMKIKINKRLRFRLFKTLESQFQLKMRAFDTSKSHTRVLSVYYFAHICMKKGCPLVRMCVRSLKFIQAIFFGNGINC